MARPSVLSDELRSRIEAQMEDGIPVVVVAQNVGVGRSTPHSWISAGRVVRRRRRDSLTLVASPVDASTEGTADGLEERLRAAGPGLVAVLVNAAQRGNWRSAAWLLERIAPDRWVRPLPRTGARGERDADFVDPFAATLRF